jgi:tetratricopeptide (TPR) repeat protein
MKQSSSRLSLGALLLIPLVTASMAFADTSAPPATPLLGADEVITRVGTLLGADPKSKQDPAKGEADRLMADLVSFKNIRAKLTAGEAAERWLKLYDRYRQLPANPTAKAMFNPYAPPTITELSLPALLAALPEPAGWSVLKERLLERQQTNDTVQDSIVKLVLYSITQDQPRLEKGLSELKANAAASGNRSYLYTLRDLRTDTTRSGAGKNGTVTADSFASYLQSLSGERPKGRLSVLVPDLVALAGEKRAEELLNKALALPGVALTVPSSGATLKLAKQVVMNRLATLTEPQWDLVTSGNDIDLYEALDKRFPEQTALQKSGSEENFQKFEENYGNPFADNPRREARIIYLLGLLSHNRVNDAVKLAITIDDDTYQSKNFEKQWHSFDKLRHSAPLNQFCSALLSERSELPLWQQCGLVALHSNTVDVLLAINNTAAAKAGIPLEARLNLRDRKIDLLLAVDKSDEALALLREALALDTGKETAQAQATFNRAKQKLAAKLCELGVVLGKTERINEAVTAYSTALVSQGLRSRIANFGDPESNQLVEALLTVGRFASAEQLVITSLSSLIQSPELNAIPGTREMALVSGLLKGHLSQLIEVYDRAGRSEDVLAVLEKAAWWGATDLLDLVEQTPALAPQVARALHKVGRNNEALELVTWHLLATPADDAAYQVLVDIQGVAALPFLEKLFSRDHFEERPLIWQAVILKADGKLDLAEKSVRQALKIDPTDGEQKAGDRGRAYMVLADTLAAKGKQDDAAFFKRVVEAVKIAETGDRMTKAGLLKRSLALYEQASGLFADAYCVQWRLAERLSALGDLAGARKHYEIAFERMPEQFGQVARVCFGCEGVFTHQQSVSVAEEVLTNLAKMSPDKQQVEYLLGQLRESQGRKSEAYRHFFRAATLDHDYLDALKEAYALRQQVFLGQTEMDALALRMLRLDPLLRHNHLDPGEISSVKDVWQVYAEHSDKHDKPVKSLLPLTASKLELETVLKKLGSNMDAMEMKAMFQREHRSVPEPGEAVVRNQFVQKLLQYAASSGLGGE